MREFLMLAKAYNKQNVKGYYASIKFDGQRAFWDGGITRGKWKTDVFFANTDRDKKPHKCTGLWSRYGNVIHAPDEWLDKLPNGVMLDGELWIDRGYFQKTREIVSRSVNFVDWAGVKFMVFDSPTPQAVFMFGKINNPNFKKVIVPPRDLRPELLALFHSLDIDENDVVKKVKQTWIKDRDHLTELMEQELKLGGEGLILRSPYQTWTPHRVSGLLKVKPKHDAEVTIRGFVYGEGKHEGRLGSMVVDWNGKIFNISGFTDVEREMFTYQPPGTTVASGSCHFQVGETITIKYVSLTDAGIPREARYFR